MQIFGGLSESAILQRRLLDVWRADESDVANASDQSTGYTSHSTTAEGLGAGATTADTLAHGVTTVEQLSGGLPSAVATVDADTATGRSDDRAERRDDRNIESDRRWRRDEGGERGTSHLSNDWAGRSILERYLTGGGDWTISDDPDWTSYLQGSDELSANLQGRAIDTAEALYAGGESSTTFDESFAASTGNGEGIVGYQYLNGSNANVGGFQREGDATIVRHDDGSATVTLELDYTWNDIIDPNPQYTTDTWKNRLAELGTLGRADPYDIHINWSETTVIELDTDGNATSIRNDE